MKPKIFLFLSGLCMLCLHINAQLKDVGLNDGATAKNLFAIASFFENQKDGGRQAATEKVFNHSYARLRFTGIEFHNYSFQYAKMLSKRFAAFVSFRYLPGGALPFANNAKAASYGAGNNSDFIDNFRMSNLALTPELHIFFGKKGYGKGFYIAPFYRYAGFSNRGFIVDFMSDAGNTHSIRLAGRLTSTTAGIMFGAKWKLTKKTFFNWWLLGPHYNSSSGSFTGACATKLSVKEQHELSRQLYALNTPLAYNKANVNAQSTQLEMNKLISGLRGGLSVGIKF